jgi:hypothetical protein
MTPTIQSRQGVEAEKYPVMAAAAASQSRGAGKGLMP